MGVRRRKRCWKLAKIPPHRNSIFEKIPVISLRYVNYITGLLRKTSAD
jgi:hypothetical protein